MKLPGSQDAIVEIEKLSDYSLSPDHPVGKHKARVFEASLGLRQDHAEEIQRRLLEAARTYECIATKLTPHGQHYEMDFMFTRAGKSALVRAVWIIRHGEKSPRLVTFHVL
ncbi:MAG: DUF6883 domain-containing protein [Prosthecobacter sp.]|uniref:DUF6883 domain-containing protein n=1 Tax=Prosthecobacter sp. TaxID=1965333 RepID=UPI0038FEFD0C